YISSSGLFPPSSSQGLQLQQQFMVDATGTPLTTQPNNAATHGASGLMATGNAPLVDPITGSAQGFAAEPELGHDNDLDHGAGGDVLPADLAFFADPVPSLSALSCCGVLDPTPTDLMAPVFPAANSTPSPTTPWPGSIQPLI
ncbi:hypothetical protein, partial [Synechococcus sp. CCY 9618]|uniref:hypothetical protein n=1 Tax=Synechococcus sp. CCY 9618 TaxID=2815602 RepID=UPI001C2196BE